MDQTIAALSLRQKSGTQTACRSCPVRGFALFGALDDSMVEWTQNWRSAQWLANPGTLIYREGQPLDESWSLQSGWVAFFKHLPDGRRQIMRFGLPGDFLGYFGDDTRTPNHGLLALDHCVLCAFPRHRLKELFVRRPELALRLMQMQTRDMAHCADHIASIGRQNARQRVATLLLHLFDRMELRGAVSGGSMAFPLSQEDIADYTGMTVVHVNRTLNALRREKLIDYGRGLLTLPDPGALARDM